MRSTSSHPSDSVVQFGRVAGSSLSTSTGAVMLNVEGVGPEEDAQVEAAVGVEFFGALGMIGRPKPPEVVNGLNLHAEHLSVRTADGLVPVAVRDVRLNQAHPNTKEGDLVWAGYASQFAKLAADGAVYLVTTTDGTPTGQLVQLQHRPDGMAYVAPWGKLTYDAGGLHVLHHSGARLDLGGIGGLPAPLDALGSYVTLAASLLKLQAAAVAVGPDAGLHDNVVKATPLEALLGQLAAALGLAATALGAIAPALAPGPAAIAAGTAITTAATALGNFAIAVGAALPPVSPTSIRSQSLTAT